MVEIAKKKESIVSSLADAETKIRDLRSYLMSTSFRLIDVSAKEEVLSKAQEASSLLKPGIDKLAEIIGAIES